MSWTDRFNRYGERLREQDYAQRMRTMPHATDAQWRAYQQQQIRNAPHARPLPSQTQYQFGPPTRDTYAWRAGQSPQEYAANFEQRMADRIAFIQFYGYSPEW